MVMVPHALGGMCQSAFAAVSRRQSDWHARRFPANRRRSAGGMALQHCAELEVATPASTLGLPAPSPDCRRPPSDGVTVAQGLARSHSAGLLQGPSPAKALAKHRRGARERRPWRELSPRRAARQTSTSRERERPTAMNDREAGVGALRRAQAAWARPWAPGAAENHMAADGAELNRTLRRSRPSQTCCGHLYTSEPIGEPWPREKTVVAPGSVCPALPRTQQYRECSRTDKPKQRLHCRHVLCQCRD
eukprot:scaffold1220_cov376-Prasinococcus_capsulatus_cf.AAC.10